MKKFKRRGRLLQCRFSEYEVKLLDSLVDQLSELIRVGMPEPAAPGTPATADPFALWERDLTAEPADPEPLEDPVLQRLFPNAYPHDPEAAHDFRRFTEHDQRTRKLADADVVRDHLAATEGGRYPVQIDETATQAWLRTLTAVRLAVATRLGVTDADSLDELAQLRDDDPRSYLLSVYEWLGYCQESLLEAL
ncbi:DUF2017 domain-containing protein [Granulicoccus phenolivorans]|uniref:DUF2017 domain-containing protein n=1 Tax=Granulicoccus phenolivorans TaxID=266854 RepID=UPI00041F4F3C|nr:DUF2017 domain-containing protein [Granulicoccus phenolivorans]